MNRDLDLDSDHYENDIDATWPSPWLHAMSVTSCILYFAVCKIVICNDKEPRRYAHSPNNVTDNCLGSKRGVPFWRAVLLRLKARRFGRPTVVAIV